MLKKALACATLAVAATGSAAALAPTAQASDVHGGNYSQNVNVLPHPCIDVKRIDNLGIPLDLLSETSGQQCNEKSKVVDAHKSPLSDVLDVGAFQN
ncbi:hypothetical protein ABZ461_02265 [Actinacidiphila glaucinigra]|uniref:hypothetical protein n=1 Tax=Actinacidiphila glaucinigra TaxID=235986 RepID=UPI0033E0D2F9